MTCQCTISTDGVFESISKIHNDTKTEPNEIDSRRSARKLPALLSFNVFMRSVHMCRLKEPFPDSIRVFGEGDVFRSKYTGR